MCVEGAGCTYGGASTDGQLLRWRVYGDGGGFEFKVWLVFKHYPPLFFWKTCTLIDIMLKRRNNSTSSGAGSNSGIFNEVAQIGANKF